MFSISVGTLGITGRGKAYNLIEANDDLEFVLHREWLLEPCETSEAQHELLSSTVAKPKCSKEHTTKPKPDQ